jgi:hypothetical protein
MQNCNSALYSLTNIQKLLGHCKKESLNYSYFHFIRGGNVQSHKLLVPVFR